jgi:hypothetical protein
MANIIAGRFHTQAEADRALAALQNAGLESGEYGSFFLNPPGQHAIHPIGGDAHTSEGASEAGKTGGVGAAIGGAAGLVIGTAAAAVAAPGFTPAAAIGGAGVGAYVGSLAGSLSGTHDSDPAVVRETPPEEAPAERPSGIIVAVCVDRSGTEDLALRALRDAGALEVERAQGDWREGSWIDFDPRRAPQLV